MQRFIIDYDLINQENKESIGGNVIKNKQLQFSFGKRFEIPIISERDLLFLVILYHTLPMSHNTAVDF